MPSTQVAHVANFDFQAPVEPITTDPVAPSCTVTFTGSTQATDGDTIRISDGEQEVTFEFDDDSSVIQGNVAVPIGASAAADLASLIAAIDASGLQVTTEDTTGVGDEQVTITLDLPRESSVGANINNRPYPTDYEQYNGLQNLALGATPPALTDYAGGVNFTALPEDRGSKHFPSGVLRLKVNNGGLVAVRIENGDGLHPLDVTLQVSADGVTWANTSAANNGDAVVNEAVARTAAVDFSVLLRQDTDNYLRLVARGTGGESRGQMQLRGRPALDIVQI